jgi:hypothetical protein
MDKGGGGGLSIRENCAPEYERRVQEINRTEGLTDTEKECKIGICHAGMLSARQQSKVWRAD